MKYYTIPEFAALRGKDISVIEAQKLGLEATKLSEEMDIDIILIATPCFGVLPAYDLDVLKEVFGC